MYTDQGSQFCSRLTQAFMERIGVSPRFNTPYHPEASGVVERWNATFKNMLHHAIREYGRQWHRIVPLLVWAAREVPSATNGLSPHLMLFGRIPRGPLAIAKEVWTGRRRTLDDQTQSAKSYLLSLEQDLKAAAKYAKSTRRRLKLSMLNTTTSEPLTSPSK